MKCVCMDVCLLAWEMDEVGESIWDTFWFGNGVTLQINDTLNQDWEQNKFFFLIANLLLFKLQKLYKLVGNKYTKAVRN